MQIDHWITSNWQSDHACSGKCSNIQTIAGAVMPSSAVPLLFQV
jgi:hypothetical protein